MMATNATLLKAAVDTGIAAFGKNGAGKANSQFRKLLKRLIGTGSDPEPAKKNMADQITKGR